MISFKSERGFSTIELLTVMSIMALMAALFVGAMLMGDDVQITTSKADIASLEAVLKLYYQDTGMYPMGGNAGMVRALSYRQGGWGNPSLLENIRKEALIQFVDGDRRYFEIVTGNTCRVTNVKSSANDPSEGQNQIVRPVRIMVDPWGTPYVYLSSSEYADPPGQNISKFIYNPKVNGVGGGKATAFRFSTGKEDDNPYQNPESYQIYSFGPDREAQAWALDKQEEGSRNERQEAQDARMDSDNIKSWSSL